MISIGSIRQANSKLLERLFLIDIAKEQDSIIKLKDNYIAQQDKELVLFKNEYNKLNEENATLKTNINNKVRTNTLIGFTVGFILSLLIK